MQTRRTPDWVTLIGDWSLLATATADPASIQLRRVNEYVGPPVDLASTSTG